MFLKKEVILVVIKSLLSLDCILTSNIPIMNVRRVSIEITINTFLFLVYLVVLSFLSSSVKYISY